ncbi:hypothetical protein RFI_20735 [Reticulomyxa filosa]|uniref:Activator of Hsp90 ATPase AHSA1-like N-terminal domain-containing protein n=1 Tax=Reticulomyxa filosa TaxID=46433 RepID=X6MRG0_RETFI|nr:hypothetical protein RFI_20735 [Reticulomyxa filosa]|eukprot:ETO16603.1 hypothetical protein RFI_20735 [Reticulomyxa filosa]
MTTTAKEDNKKKQNANSDTMSSSSRESTPEEEIKNKKKDTKAAKGDSENKTKSKIDSSSYYFFKSTDPEQAKKFKPQKVDEQTAKEKEEQTASKSMGSLWNTGSTMEEYDYSEWVHQQLKQELLRVQFKGAPIKIDEVEKVDGTVLLRGGRKKKEQMCICACAKATYLLTRGKLRAGWDLSFKAKWKGIVDEKEVEGTISMEDIADGEDSDEWGFEVECKKSRSEDQKARSTILKEKKSVLGTVERVLKEFKSKKTNLTTEKKEKKKGRTNPKKKKTSVNECDLYLLCFVSSFILTPTIFHVLFVWLLFFFFFLWHVVLALYKIHTVWTEHIPFSFFSPFLQLGFLMLWFFNSRHHKTKQLISKWKKKR